MWHDTVKSLKVEDGQWSLKDLFLCPNTSLSPDVVHLPHNIMIIIMLDFSGYINSGKSQ